MNPYQELLDLYEKLNQYKVVAPPAHTTISPQIGVLLDHSGNFMAAKYINEKCIVPCTEESESRSSNVAPHVIHDNLSYIGNLPGYEDRHTAYLKQLRAYTEAADDALAKSVLLHIEKDLLMQELRPLLDGIPYPPEKIPVVFGNPDTKNTISQTWHDYYIPRLPKNGICSITNTEAYIPRTYPRNIRYQGDFARLFSRGNNKQPGMPELAPGYITSQKIIHTLQWLASGQEVTVGDDNGPLYNYIPLKDYARLHNANPANVRQKILRGTLAGEKFGSEWFIDKNQPYDDKRKKS